MKIVAMVDRSAGNKSVGEMWTECAEFDDTTPISAVLEWAKMFYIHDVFPPGALEPIKQRMDVNTTRNVRIAILQNPTA